MSRAHRAHQIAKFSALQDEHPRQSGPPAEAQRPKPNGGNSKPEPKKPKKPGNQKSALSPSESVPEREHIHFAYIGKDESRVIGDTYKECELYAAFMANERMANDFADRGGKKRKRNKRRKGRCTRFGRTSASKTRPTASTTQSVRRAGACSTWG